MQYNSVRKKFMKYEFARSQLPVNEWLAPSSPRIKGWILANLSPNLKEIHASSQKKGWHSRLNNQLRYWPNIKISLLKRSHCLRKYKNHSFWKRPVLLKILLCIFPTMLWVLSNCNQYWLQIFYNNFRINALSYMPALYKIMKHKIYKNNAGTWGG